jgi:hypothetical protein
MCSLGHAGRFAPIVSLSRAGVRTRACAHEQNSTIGAKRPVRPVCLRCFVSCEQARHRPQRHIMVDRAGSTSWLSSARRAPAAALKHPKGAKCSNEQIAEHVGVSPPMVSKYRQEVEATLKVLESSTRTGKDGRTINTENIGRKPTLGRGQANGAFCGCLSRTSICPQIPDSQLFEMR